MPADTGLTEQIMGTTSTDEFNRALEIQQSASVACPSASPSLPI